MTLMVKFSGDVIVDVIDTDSPEVATQSGYVVLPEDRTDTDTRRIRPDMSIRSDDDMRSEGLWPQSPVGQAVEDKPAMTVQEQVVMIRSKVSDIIESKLQAKANELGYQNFMRAGLYLTSPVQKYKDEAQSLTAWAARMYEYVETLEQTLTIEQLLAYDLSTLEFPQYEAVIAN